MAPNQPNQGNQPVEPVPEGTTPLGAAKGDMTQTVDTTGTDDNVNQAATPETGQDNLTDTNPLYRDDNPQANLGQQVEQPPTNLGAEKTNMGQMSDEEKSDYQQSLEENDQRVEENSGTADTTSKGPNPQTQDTSGS